MNCPVCGEVCRCLPELQSAGLAKWTPDAAHFAASSEIASVRAASMAAQPAGGDPEFGSGTRRQEAEATNEYGCGESWQSSASADSDQAPATAWRDELTERLNLYRARRKPRPPRYPSLRLEFDCLHAADPDGQPGDVRDIVSHHALALDAFDPSGPQSDAAAAEIALPPGTGDPSASTASGAQPASRNSRPQQVGRVIEFPRSSSAGPPVPLEELAGPVTSQLRILEVPEVVPPPPALGGITIESPQPEDAEKRPGIDVPLQSAPLARRLIAGAIDATIVVLACALSGYIFWKVSAMRPPKFQMLALSAGIPALLWATYQSLLIIYAGSTIGLGLANLKLARFDGSPAHRKLRRWRVLASFVSALSLGMGYIWVFLDEDGLCWHDRITRTYLAQKPGAK